MQCNVWLLCLLGLCVVLPFDCTVRAGDAEVQHFTQCSTSAVDSQGQHAFTLQVNICVPYCMCKESLL